MNVLYADDDPLVRELLGAVLGGLGHAGVPARDGEEAWRLYEASRPPLVVLDLDMPGRSGLDLCRAIRQQDTQRETFILVLKERDSQDDLAAVLDAGADDYVTKPATQENLMARLVIAQQRIQQERARRTAEADLQRARWLAGIGETTIMLQHQINNPLAALIGHAELMIMEAKEKGAPDEKASIILEQARRIADVVRRLGELRNPQTVEYAAGARMIELPEGSE